MKFPRVFSLQDVFHEKTSSLPNYAYDRCVCIFQAILWFCSLTKNGHYCIRVPQQQCFVFGFFSLPVPSLMLHLVKKQVMAMTAWPVEEKGKENTENIIASQLGCALGMKRWANPNSACSMWETGFICFPKLHFPQTRFLFAKRGLCPYRFVTRVTRWLNVSWRLTITKWWRLNLIWMVTLQRKLPRTWFVQHLNLMFMFSLSSSVVLEHVALFDFRWRMDLSFL